MVDYVQLISRAVTTLNPNTREARQALYQRARQTLVDKLRSADPTLSHTDLNAERAALESAIQQVERDAVRRTAPPQRQPVQDRAQDRYDYRDRPPLKDPRNWLRTAAVALGVLLVFAVGAGIYSFWPRNLDDVRSMAKQRNVSSTSDPAEIKSDFVRLRQLVYYRTTQPVGRSWSTNRRPFSTSYDPISPRCATASALAPNAPRCPDSITLRARRNCLAGNHPASNRPFRPFTRPLSGQGGYRIHGFDGSARISLPEGCIRLIKDDVIYLYNHTPLETPVVVAN
jgi:hypothetical protein